MRDFSAASRAASSFAKALCRARAPVSRLSASDAALEVKAMGTLGFGLL